MTLKQQQHLFARFAGLCTLRKDQNMDQTTVVINFVLFVLSVSKRTAFLITQLWINVLAS